MPKLFNEFRRLKDDFLMILALREEDVDNLSTLTSKENVYRYIPPFLYKKSRGNLLVAIRNLSV